MSRATLALIRAAWQEGWNQQWRFSRFKMGLWLIMGQIGLAALVRWRLESGMSDGGLSLALITLCTHVGTWGLLGGFLSGRKRLYTGPAALLLHNSPAAPISLICAQTAQAVPRRALTALLISLVLTTWMLPDRPWWAFLLLWVAAVSVGLVADLVGLLLLVAWVRRAPGALGVVQGGALLMQISLIWYLIFLMATGLSPEGLKASLEGIRHLLGAGLLLLIGLPGALLMLWVLRLPGGVGQAYREGWLALGERAGEKGQLRRSRWPRIWSGKVGVVQAKDWLLAIRNPFTMVRLGVVAAILLALIPGRQWLMAAATAAVHPDLLLLGLGIGLVAFAFGEMVVGIFTPDAPVLGLYLTIGVHPSRILLAKLLGAAVPYGLLTSLSTGLIGLAAGSTWADLFRLILTAGLISLGMAILMAGAAALDVRPVETGETSAGTLVTSALEQIPQGAAGVVGLLLALGYGGVGVWFSTTGAGPAVAPVLLAVSATSLLIGYRRLCRLVRTGL